MDLVVHVISSEMWSYFYHYVYFITRIFAAYCILLRLLLCYYNRRSVTFVTYQCPFCCVLCSIKSIQCRQPNPLCGRPTLFFQSIIPNTNDLSVLIHSNMSGCFYCVTSWSKSLLQVYDCFNYLGITVVRDPYSNVQSSLNHRKDICPSLRRLSTLSYKSFMYFISIKRRYFVNVSARLPV